MKILFLLSTNVWFDHLSGEQEAKALQLGFSLLGIQCDIAGIDADDFGEYDVYVMFSMSPDVQEKIKFIEKHKKIIVVPQTEDYSDATLDRLADSSYKVEGFYIVVRNEVERHFFSRHWPRENLISTGGWFIEPFVWNDETTSFHCPEQDYILSFVGDSIGEQAISFFTNSDRLFKRVVVGSHRCMDTYFPDVVDESLELRKPVKYGAAEWFWLLSNGKYYYEPNSRLTSGMLESLWLGGEVISPHYQMMNGSLGMALVVGSENESSGVSVQEKRDCVRQFRVERVAQHIVSRIDGGRVCANIR